jgi:ornithine cyclodeaminase/alanine dehydrogenase-like protein (mu-crystallin family)
MKYNHSLSAAADGGRPGAEVGGMRLIHLDNVRLQELIEPAGLVQSIRNGFNGNLDSSPRLHQTIPGAHPAMREADDDVFRRARVIVDTYDRRRESGDLLDLVATGALDATKVRDLATLLRDATVARRGTEEITVFKAVGSAIADLAVAQFFLRRHYETPTTNTGAIR